MECKRTLGRPVDLPILGNFTLTTNSLCTRTKDEMKNKSLTYYNKYFDVDANIKYVELFGLNIVQTYF